MGAGQSGKESLKGAGLGRWKPGCHTAVTLYWGKKRMGGEWVRGMRGQREALSWVPESQRRSGGRRGGSPLSPLAVCSCCRRPSDLSSGGQPLPWRSWSETWSETCWSLRRLFSGPDMPAGVGGEMLYPRGLKLHRDGI